MGCCEKCGNLDKSKIKGDKNYYLYGCTVRKSGFIKHGITNDVALKILSCELYGKQIKAVKPEETKGQISMFQE